MITDPENEFVKEWLEGNVQVIDDIGEGHKVELVEYHEDTDHLSLAFHADDGRVIEDGIRKDELRLDTGKTAGNFGADAILVTPGHISGDIHERANGIYG